MPKLGMRLIVSALLAACSTPKPSLTRLTSGSTTAGATTNTGGSSGSGSTGAATTGSSTASGTTTGADVPCASGAVWRGDFCSRLDCRNAPLMSHCVLADGGVGTCGGGNCLAIDPQTDPANCGGYGLTCPVGNGCQFGLCTTDAGCSGAPTCPSGKGPVSVGTAAEDCGWRCVLSSCTSADDQACLLRNSYYPTTGICCGGSCIPFSADPLNCGACGLSCGDGGLCFPPFLTSHSTDPIFPIAVQCVPAPPCDSTHNNFPCEIDGGFGVCCLGACVSPSACGGCGQSCAEDGGPYSSGVCPDGSILDDSHYYANNGPFCSPTSCSGLQDGLICVSSAGSFSGPLQCCGGACIDVRDDALNCGGCGFRCPAGMACDYGSCEPQIDCSAAANEASCWLDAGAVGQCCGGVCVDDPNCATFSDCRPGSTGVACFTDAGAAGQCCGGECLYEYQCISRDPPPCDAGTDCAVGSVCLGGSCYPTWCPPDSNGVACAFGPGGSLPWGVCCAGQCVNTFYDPDNCIACGVSCGAGVCAGRCLPAQPDSDCLGNCVAGTVCVLGLCVDSFCQSLLAGPSYGLYGYGISLSGGFAGVPNIGVVGFDFCAASDGLPGLCDLRSGACADLGNDPMNCGDFGYACPAGQTCNQGVCSGAPPECGRGRIGAFCNLDAGQGFACCPGAGCTDTDTDNANCGGCGFICAQGQSCSAGSCQ